MPHKAPSGNDSRDGGTALESRVSVPSLLLEQTLSFVSHDLFGPMSMLRTYLQAVGGQRTAGDDLEDAVGMAVQLEGLAGVLRDSVRLLLDRLAVSPTRLDLSGFLHEWTRKNAAVELLPGPDQARAGEYRVMVDRDILGRALEYAAWQIARMGARRGNVGIALRKTGHACEIVLSRTDTHLEEGVLARALDDHAPDQLSFLRRLPASGYPLRVSKGLVEAMGGNVRTGGEEAGCGNLSISFACAGRSRGPAAGTKDEAG